MWTKDNARDFTNCTAPRFESDGSDLLALVVG